MNEYQERHRISQLLGAPPSYIGYGDGTQLTDRIAAQPESVVLFDEIEKAHRDVLVTLMSAMDIGELSSPGPTARGPGIDCRRAVFFFTSNIDVADAITELDADGTVISVPAICRRHPEAGRIQPELVGRISAFPIFRPLSARARAEIATAAVAKVAAEYGLQVVRVAPEVVSAIVSRPYDNLGARPDECYIDEFLASEFSRYIANGGQPTVKIDVGPAPTCVPADDSAIPGKQSAASRSVAVAIQPEVIATRRCPVRFWRAGGTRRVCRALTAIHINQGGVTFRRKVSGLAESKGPSVRPMRRRTLDPSLRMAWEAPG